MTLLQLGSLPRVFEFLDDRVLRLGVVLLGRVVGLLVGEPEHGLVEG